MVARQTVALSRTHAGKTVTIEVTDTEQGRRLRRRPHALSAGRIRPDPEPGSQPAQQGRAMKPKPTVKLQLRRIRQASGGTRQRHSGVSYSA
jgi:hypothetical protein